MSIKFEYPNAQITKPFEVGGVYFDLTEFRVERLWLSLSPTSPKGSNKEPHLEITSSTLHGFVSKVRALEQACSAKPEKKVYNKNLSRALNKSLNKAINYLRSEKFSIKDVNESLFLVLKEYPIKTEQVVPVDAPSYFLYTARYEVMNLKTQTVYTNHSVSYTNVHKSSSEVRVG